MSVFNPFLCCLSPFYLVLCHCFKAKLLVGILTVTWLQENLQTFLVRNNNTYQLTILVVSLYIAKKTSSFVLDNLNFEASIH